MDHHHITVDDSIYHLLAAKAARQHVSVEDLVAPALHRIAAPDPRADEPAAARLTPAEWRAERDAWKRDAEARAAWYPETHALATGREAIYEERLQDLS